MLKQAGRELPRQLTRLPGDSARNPMADRDHHTDGTPGKSRRSPLGWLLGGALLVLLAILALRGMSAGVDRDGSANADGPAANADAH
jgi:hypothetical protein